MSSSWGSLHSHGPAADSVVLEWLFTWDREYRGGTRMRLGCLSVTLEKYPDLTRQREVLGFEPTISLEEGIGRVLRKVRMRIETAQAANCAGVGSSGPQLSEVNP